MCTPLDLQFNAIGWYLTEHAKERARTRGVKLTHILEALARPDLTYPQRRNTIMTRGRLAVVADQASRAVVTVLLTGSDAWDDSQARAVLSSRQ